VIIMYFDLAEVTEGWIKRGERQSARLIRAANGRPVLQLYEALAVFQMEISGRPDGVRPGGYDSMLQMMRNRATGAEKARPAPQNWMELDREFAQYNQRRKAAALVAAAAKAQNITDWARVLYELAGHDTAHCLDILTFAEEEHPSGRLPSVGPELRPVLTTQQTIAHAQLAMIAGDFEFAVEHLHSGRVTVCALLEKAGVSVVSENAYVRELCALEQQIREQHGVERTLSEQLDDAVGHEDFERAASLRDRIAQRNAGQAERLVMPEM
jgi:hypothetical protein